MTNRVNDTRDHILGAIQQAKNAEAMIAAAVARYAKGEITSAEQVVSLVERALPKITTAIAFAETALSRGAWAEWKS